MAGEWIPVDLSIGSKPEILELVEVAAVSVEVAVYRVFQMWAWFSLNSSDGTARATPERLARVCGGDAEFWRHVQRVGWVFFDDSAQTATIPGWESRFSNAAKSRANHAKAQRRFRERQSSDQSVMVADHLRDAARSPEEKREEEKRREKNKTAAQSAASGPKRPRSTAPKITWSAEAGWQGIGEADRAGWREAFPGAVIDTELAKATEWLKANPSKAGKRNWRAFLVRWLQRCQDSGGTNRQPANRPGQPFAPPPSDPAKRRWFRSDAQRSMTDAEYAAWRRSPKPTGVAESLSRSISIARLDEESDPSKGGDHVPF